MKSEVIAKLAGVSRSTVSRVINNYPDISQETREKVLKIIKENNYYPNLSAQKLAGKNTGIIGLLIYTGKIIESGSYKRVSDSLYYSELVSKIIDASEKLGYSVLTSYINKKNNNWKKIFGNGLIDGAIVISGGKKSKEIEELIRSKNKVVLLDYEKYISNKTTSTVNPDNYQGGYKATEFLISNGHEKILHLMGDLKRKMSIKRARGYLDCLKKYGIKESKIISGEFTEKSGYKIIEEYIKENKSFDYTAIFAGNDYVAVGAMKALKKYNIRVPEDVSIIGFDNMLLGEYTFPTITSINHLDKQIAEKSLKKLVKLIDGEEGTEETTNVEIVERESVYNLKK